MKQKSKEGRRKNLLFKRGFAWAGLRYLLRLSTRGNLQLCLTWPYPLMLPLSSLYGACCLQPYCLLSPRTCPILFLTQIISWISKGSYKIPPTVLDCPTEVISHLPYPWWLGPECPDSNLVQGDAKFQGTGPLDLHLSFDSWVGFFTQACKVEPFSWRDTGMKEFKSQFYHGLLHSLLLSGPQNKEFRQDWQFLKIHY